MNIQDASLTNFMETTEMQVCMHLSMLLDPICTCTILLHGRTVAPACMRDRTPVDHHILLPITDVCQCSRHRLKPVWVPAAGEPAPAVLLPSYKSTRVRDAEHEGRGTCVALVKRDGEFHACGLPVASRGRAAQVCDGHLRAPTVLMADAIQAGLGKYWRFCVTHACFRPLGKFQGFLAHCTEHDAGLSEHGRPPLVPVQVDGEELVLRPRGTCATLAWGQTPRSVRKGLTHCDVEGCGEEVHGACGFCFQHRHVRDSPFAPAISCVMCCTVTITWTMHPIVMHYIRRCNLQCAMLESMTPRSRGLLQNGEVCRDLSSRRRMIWEAMSRLARGKSVCCVPSVCTAEPALSLSRARHHT